MEYGVGTRSAKFAPLAVRQGNFDYNDRVEVDVSQKRFNDFWIRPIGGVVNQAGPFTFCIDPIPDKYLQLNRARLEVICRVVGEMGQALDSCLDLVAPINLLGPCMWENVEVMLNGQPFSGASSINCGYKAYIETMLSYDQDAANTHLHSQFFHLDSPGEYSVMKVNDRLLREVYLNALLNGRARGPRIPPNLEPDPDLADDFPDENILLLTDEEAEAIKTASYATAQVGETDEERKIREEKEKKRRRMVLILEYYEHEADVTRKTLVLHNKCPSNKGFDARYKITNGSVSFDLYSPITHDFFRMNNHIAPGNKIDLRLTMHKHAFLLNSGLPRSRYRLQIDDMKLHLRTIELKESIKPPLEERYRLNETQMHKQIVGKDLPSTMFRIHNGGTMPKTIIFAFAETRAVEGDYQRNPWNFHHFYLEQMSLIINGESYPSDGLRMDFTKENPQTSRVYHWMFENTGSADGEKGNLVHYNAFRSGAFIIPFDLTPDKCNGLHNHEGESGFIDVQLKFAMPLPDPIYVLYELVFNKVLQNHRATGEVIVLDVDA